jgi:hypothetical protein
MYKDLYLTKSQIKKYNNIEINNKSWISHTQSVLQPNKVWVKKSHF